MIMIAVALLLSMVLCLLFGVPYIDFLRKKTTPIPHLKNKNRPQRNATPK